MYSACAFHSAIEPDVRRQLMKAFLRPTGTEASGDDTPLVLISTDRASRGNLCIPFFGPHFFFICFQRSVWVTLFVE